MTKWAARLAVFSALAVLWAVFFVAAGLADGPSYRTPRIAQPAPEQTLPTAREWSWTGIYLGVGVGTGTAITDLDAAIVDSGPGAIASINGVGAWDYLADARLGLDYQFKGTPFVAGVFIGYGIGSMEADASIGAATAALEITPTWNAGARVGIVAPYNSLLYVGYKYQMADLDLRTTGLGGHSVSREIDGHGLILGGEMPITKAFTLQLEYGYTQFDTGQLGDGGIDVRGDTDVQTVMLRGNVRIGPNLFGN